MKAIIYSALVVFIAGCTTVEPVKVPVKTAALSPQP